VISYVAVSWLGLLLLASASSIIACIPLLIPATIVPLQLNWVVKSLPTLQRVDSNAYLEPELQRYTSEMTKWLHSLLQLVDDPTVAKLMELRLRDAIRSPLLDVPELTVAVWRAGAAGSRVTLIDDRSPTCADPEEHSKIIANATDALAKNPHTLTLRLAPAGRGRPGAGRGGVGGGVLGGLFRLDYFGFHNRRGIGGDVLGVSDGGGEAQAHGNREGDKCFTHNEKISITHLLPHSLFHKFIICYLTLGGIY